jgi:hypothetical protein
LIAWVLRKFRKSCWLFAIYLAVHPDKVREKTVNQMAWTAALCAWYLHPPEYWRLTPAIIRAIAKRECRDTADNLRALNEPMIRPAGPICGRGGRGLRTAADRHRAPAPTSP